MIDYTLILLNKFSGKEWTLNGEDYSGLTWLSSGEKPSQEELDNLWEEVQLEITAERTAKENDKQIALAKLEALGLTAEDIKNIIKGLN